MSTYESRQELADKAAWEGGLLELITGYGLSVDDLPEDDYLLRATVFAVLQKWNEMKHYYEELQAMLPEPGYE